MDSHNPKREDTSLQQRRRVLLRKLGKVNQQIASTQKQVDRLQMRIERLQATTRKAA